MSVETSNTLTRAEFKQVQSSIAMTVLLVSWSMLFLSLFLGYAVYRFNALVWPPMGMERVELFLPSLSTFIILASSFSFHYFQTMFEKEKRIEKNWILFTIILGILFVLSQTWLWSNMKASGVFVSSGIFPSVLYGFTWIHAAHVAFGILGLLWLYFFGVSAQKQEINLRLNIQNVGKFWHFIDIVWIVMYLTLFVL